jgi:hypothetical protein
VNGGWETSYFDIVPSSHLRSKGFLALAVLHPRRLFSPSHDSDGPVAWEQQGATYQVIKSNQVTAIVFVNYAMPTAAITLYQQNP